MVLLFAVNVYRAATQSITTDEAFTYTRSVQVPIPKLWEVFDANDHVLHTLLCKVTTKWFGASEFTLRMPSLAAGLLYLWVCLQLCGLVTQTGWALLLSYALLVLNPLMLDYSSIARGYGMATTLMLVALDQVVRFLRAPLQQWRLYAIGVLLALAVVANLTAVVPGTALIATLMALYLGPPLRERNWPRFHYRLGMVIDYTVIPTVVLCTVLLVAPMLHAERGSFYVGSDNLADAAGSIIDATFRRHFNLLEHTQVHAWVDALLGRSTWMTVVLLAGALLLALRRRCADMLAVVSMVTAGSLMLLILLHTTMGMLYPERRTGLYLVPLFTLMAMAAAQVVPRLVQRATAVVALLSLAIFVTEWNVYYYDEWLFDADNRALMAYVRDHTPAKGRALTIGATFPFRLSIDYYRSIWKLKGLAPTHDGADGNFDLYVLANDQTGLIQKLNLTPRVRFRSGVTLATSASSALLP